MNFQSLVSKVRKEFKTIDDAKVIIILALFEKWQNFNFFFKKLIYETIKSFEFFQKFINSYFSHSEDEATLQVYSKNMKFF
jgi:hypothetical protein